MPFLRLPGRPAVFYVNVVLAVVAMLAAFAVVPRDPEWYVQNALTGASGPTPLVFALVQGPEFGWSSSAIPGCSTLSALFLAVLIGVANGDAAGQAGIAHTAAVANDIRIGF